MCGKRENMKSEKQTQHLASPAYFVHWLFPTCANSPKYTDSISTTLTHYYGSSTLKDI